MQEKIVEKFKNYRLFSRKTPTTFKHSRNKRIIKISILEIMHMVTKFG